MFLFRNLWKLPEPPSPVLTKGILVHTALEKVFELPPEQRAAKVHDVLRAAWRVERLKEKDGKKLVESLFASREAEAKWGRECLALLDTWLSVENPAAMPSGEPLAHEAWLEARLPTADVDPALPPLTLVGKVDRLDVWPASGGGGLNAGGGLVIVDYKTGRSPRSYSPQMDEQIRKKNFFQLRAYALLLEKGGLRGSNVANTRGDVTLRARRLQLLYLGDGVAETQAEIVAAWAAIAALVAANDPTAFAHCDRKYCQCHELRPHVFGDDGPGKFFPGAPPSGTVPF